jgi:2C-methyl-D-erythritol 2,4-cyclodiphosphate synthase
MTIDKALIQLKNIRTVTMSDNRKILMPLTKIQKSILSALNIKMDKIESELNLCR